MNPSKSPLRYPGGKQRLTPFINEILEVNNIQGHYAEVYAGGAGVALELLLTNKIDFIHLNDSDFGIYSFWHSVLNRTDELCNLISTASLTVEEWRNRREILKTEDRRRVLELGFSVFYLNRCNRSGVISGGLIGGLNQDGNYKMDVRFSRNDLIRRIEAIALHRDRIFISNMDAEEYIATYIPLLPKRNTLVYMDPPYYQKGSVLYLNHYKKGDHERLAQIIQEELDHKWVLSYDGVPDIIELYEERRHFLYDLQYSAAKSYKGKEIFIFDDDIELPLRSSLPNISAGMEAIVIP